MSTETPTTEQKQPLPECSAPATLEGAFVLHRMYHVDWRGLARLEPESRKMVARECADLMEKLFRRGERDESGAAFRMVGDKGELMVILYRQTPDELVACERELAELRLNDFLTPSWAYLSVVELSLHGAAERHRAKLEKSGMKASTPEWDQALEDLLEGERNSMRDRLYPQVPDTRYVCFYPMNKRRGELKNWFTLTNAQRSQMMVGHGKTGRKFARKVTQIISSSVGFDDYDWGVDLYSDDPIAFKKLVYEMRFDEVSAVYAEFGPFVLGVRTPPERLLD